MKKGAGKWLAVLCLIGGWAAAEIEQPHIAVIGRAEAEVIPDELVWALSVKTLGANITDVAAAHAKEVSAVLDFLSSHVEKKEIRTQRMRLNENWEYRDRSRVQEGYVASTAITFTSRDVSKYLALWTGLSKCANTSIGGATFRVSNRREIEEILRVEAVADARKKAVALAEAGGVMLYEPIVIEETGITSPGPIRMQRGFSDAAVSEPIEPGTETIQAAINVYFRIGPK